MTIQFFVSIGPLPPTDGDSSDYWYDSRGPFSSLTDAQDYVRESDLTADYTIDEQSVSPAGSISVRQIRQ